MSNSQHVPTPAARLLSHTAKAKGQAPTSALTRRERTGEVSPDRTLGAQVPSASGRYGYKTYVCFAPRVWSRSQLTQGAWQHPANSVEEALCSLLVAATSSQQHQLHSFAKETRPILVPGTRSTALPHRSGDTRLVGHWKQRSQQPSQPVGMPRWLQG